MCVVSYMSDANSESTRFRRVYETVYPIIIRIVYRITGSLEVSEEICHEAFIKYLDRIQSIPDPEQAKYWLIRVSKNLALNNEKRRGREIRAYEKASRNSPSSEESGEHSFFKQESLSGIQAAIQALPENLRVVLVMKEYGDLSYREIGTVLGISEGNVKVRAFRAREKLAEILKRGEFHAP
jgi:RNA polymerase sigma factor (sigma-70 family)